MVFSSMTFLPLFLPLVILPYFLVRSLRAKNAILLAFSLLFYAWGEPKWILVMLLTVTVNYIAGLLIDRAKTEGARRLWMIVGVAVSLAFLVFFKYTRFFADTLLALFSYQLPFTSPALPIGISFYTFQVLTYTVDVYRRKVGVQKSYTDLLLYVSFFPQLIAGPIVNYTDIAASLSARKHTKRGVYEGMMRFFIGLAKKVLLANTCGVIVESLGANPLSVAGAWLMIFAYALQIYFDFSGYSDMAIGIGRVFGFRFLENFNYPYISKSVTEFWRRWHISLGSFFREYVYIPLGGNRVSVWKHIRNIAIVWFLTGFWHGAAWNFILWGLYYGMLLLIEKFLLGRIKDKLPAFINIAVTLLLVLIGWVFFYYEDLSLCMLHLSTMFGFSGAAAIDPAATYYFKYNLVILVAAVLACLPWKAIFGKLPEKLQNVFAFIAPYTKPVAATLLLLLSVGMMITQSYNPFLYFRF